MCLAKRAVHTCIRTHFCLHAYLQILWVFLPFVLSSTRNKLSVGLFCVNIGAIAILYNKSVVAARERYAENQKVYKMKMRKTGKPSPTTKPPPPTPHGKSKAVNIKKIPKREHTRLQAHSDVEGTGSFWVRHFRFF